MKKDATAAENRVLPEQRGNPWDRRRAKSLTDEARGRSGRSFYFCTERAASAACPQHAVVRLSERLMENSKIAWTDHTFNPWIGCSPVSEACANCYAAAMSKRWGHDFHQRRLTKTWHEPLKWQARAEADGRRFRVFCGSMMDVFDRVNPEWHARLWSLIGATPSLDWLLLTKRPEALPRRFWPDNVMLGVTAETQERLTERALWLTLKRPDCGGFFVSAEPLLGEIDPARLDFFDWIIVGAEKIGTRPGRPMHGGWARRIVEECKKPVFVKQMDVGGRVSDDPDLFPSWARRREFRP